MVGVVLFSPRSFRDTGIVFVIVIVPTWHVVQGKKKDRRALGLALFEGGGSVKDRTRDLHLIGPSSALGERPVRGTSKPPRAPR